MEIKRERERERDAVREKERERERKEEPHKGGPVTVSAPPPSQTGREGLTLTDCEVETLLEHTHINTNIHHDQTVSKQPLLSTPHPHPASHTG